ncbi:putative nuclease HARBI1 [Galleria mellonella]|uniref:Nuclease HARBI1 n=1 Tax=Galleria mellonella TaxID=7137 RepID=A0ABM3MV82_GALME|nr:putative nuclease HARBI1 [Galleria mellonella]
MSDEGEILEFLEMDAMYEAEQRKIKRRRLRDQSNPFDIDDEQFIKRYRLSKSLVYSLCDELRPHMAGSSKSTDLTLETKVLVALSFFATGSYQRPIGDIAGHSIAQPTVSIIIKQITKLLNLPEIQAKYIKFPRTSEERRANIIRFYNKFGMPGVLGCIDCTHVAIVRPTENEERYYCRKQYHSLNVQLISNADMEIISVDASYGGATHDSFIWTNHPLRQHLEQLSRNESIWLLGDSGYALRKYMMTPITNTVPGSQEAHYTSVHVRTRNVIERTIGLLKARFRCLLVHRVLHYAPEVAASIVNACVVLHNMTVKSNIPAPTLTDEDATSEGTMQLHHAHHDLSQSSSVELNEGLAARRALVSRLWSSRASTN